MTPFFDYLPEVWRIIYTSNAIASVNMSLRKIAKNRGRFRVTMRWWNRSI